MIWLITFQKSILQIFILGFMFFYGEFILEKVKDFVKDQTKNPVGRFFWAIGVIILLSAIPLISSEILLLFGTDVGWGLIILFLGLNAYKFNKEWL